MPSDEMHTFDLIASSLLLDGEELGVVKRVGPDELTGHVIKPDVGTMWFSIVRGVFDGYVINTEDGMAPKNARVVDGGVIFDSP